tara:strand:+ start:3136 stop:5001 length:1866 start_codon:yes stop_codon:yes gene_type:complete
MNINNELLQIARENNNSNLSNTSLASVCLYYIYKKPFFNNQYSDYIFKEDQYNKEITLTKATQDYSDKYFDNDFDHSFIKQGDYNIVEKNDDDEDDYFFNYEDESLRIYTEKDINNLIKLKSIIKKSNDINELENFLKIELKNNENFLNELKRISEIQNIIYDIDNLFKLNKEENQNNNKINFFGNLSSSVKKYSSLFIRDFCNDFFLMHNFNKDPKEIYQQLLENDREFNSFLRNTGYEGEYNYNDSFSKKEKKDILKKLIKEKDEYTLLILKNPPSKRTKFLNEALLKNKEKYFKEIDSVNINECIENIYKENKDSIEKIIATYSNNNPIIENKINHNDIRTHIIIAEKKEITKIFGKDKVFCPVSENESKKKYKIPDHFLYKEIENDDNFSEDILKSKYSINSCYISKADGMKLHTPEAFKDDYNDDDIIAIQLVVDSHIIGKIGLRIDKKNYCAKIKSTDILEPYRKQGLSYQLYNSVADFCENNNLVLVSSMYTENGKNFLPSVKRKLVNERDNFLCASFLDDDNFFSPIYRLGKLFQPYENTIKDKNLNYNDLKKLFKIFKKEEHKLLNNIENSNDYKSLNEYQAESRKREISSKQTIKEVEKIIKNKHKNKPRV